MVGRLVVVALARPDGGLGVEGEGPDRAGENAALVAGEGADLCHDVISFACEAARCGLDRRTSAAARTALHPQGRSAAEDAGRELSCSARRARNAPGEDSSRSRVAAPDGLPQAAVQERSSGGLGQKSGMTGTVRATQKP